MAYPWSAGDTLNAADLNDYAGLVFIKSQAIGTGVSSVTVSNAFSSQFKNYRIITSLWTGSNTVVALKLSGATGATDYDSKMQYFTVYAAGGFATQTALAGDRWFIAHSTSAVSSPHNGAAIDLFAPNINGRQRYVSTYASYVSGITAGQTASTSGNASTGFTIEPTSGTLQGGTIQVFGYNDG